MNVILLVSAAVMVPMMRGPPQGSPLNSQGSRYSEQELKKPAGSKSTVGKISMVASGHGPDANNIAHQRNTQKKRLTPVQRIPAIAAKWNTTTNVALNVSISFASTAFIYFYFLADLRSYLGQIIAATISERSAKLIFVANLHRATTHKLVTGRWHLEPCGSAEKFTCELPGYVITPVTVCQVFSPATFF